MQPLAAVPEKLRSPRAIWIATGAAMIVALFTIRLVTASVLPQQLPWPTPPPGPGFQPPSESAAAATVVVPADRPESETGFVPPRWPGRLPLIPPLPIAEVNFEGSTWGFPFQLRIEAGTFSEAVQIRVTPISPSSFPAAPLGLIIAFELEALDIESQAITEPLGRPVLLSFPAERLVQAGADGKALLFHRASDTGLRPLVTVYNMVTHELTIRLSDLGVLALVQDMR